MKIKHFTLSLLSILLVVACKDEPKEDPGRTIGKLNISKKYPQPGDTIQLTYNGQLDKDSYFFYQVGKNTYTESFIFDKGDNPALFSVEIPDSADALLFNFKNETRLDHNNHNGYSTLLYNDDFKPVKNSRIAKSFLYHRYGTDLELETENNTLISWMKKDFKANDSAEIKWGNLYYQFLNKKNPDEALLYAKNRIASYEKKEVQDEEQMSDLINYYTLLGEKEKVEQLKQNARSKYPKGEIAKTEYLEEFSKTTDPRRREEIYLKYNSEFGSKNNIEESSYMISQIAHGYAEQGSIEMSMKIGNEIPNPLTKAKLYNSIAWDLAEKDENIEAANNMSKTSLEIIEKELKTFSQKPNDVYVTNYKEMLAYDYQMYADTYAYILYKQGNLKEAITNQKKAIGNGDNIEINERYVKLLKEAEEYKDLENTASRFIVQNSANAQIKEYYKFAYKENHPNSLENAFKNELQQLESKGKQLAAEKIKKEKISKEAPDFVLEDASGDRVKLSKLKGKTVILDFWATWCGPCIASFPGMKKVVEEYEKNENVIIFFVNTFESGSMEERLKKSKEFMEANNYPFQVLFDTSIEGSKEFTVAQQFGINGIPSKIIIGPDGKINFETVGYSGNNEKMLQEIDLMVELSQMK